MPNANLPPHDGTNEFSLGRSLSKALILSFISGSIPAYMIYAFEGVDGFLAFINTLSPAAPYAWYLLLLFSIQPILFALNRFRTQDSNVSEFFIKAEKYWSQLSFSIIGVFRLIIGALLVILYVYYDYQGNLPPKMVFLTVLATLMYLFPVALMDWLQSQSQNIPRDTARWKQDFSRINIMNRVQIKP